MKSMIPSVVVLLVFLAAAQGMSADYAITINGKSQDIDLDRKTTMVLPDGTTLYITLQQKEYLRFSGKLFSFEHKNRYKPNRNDLGEGNFQTSIVTPLGTGIIIQEYTRASPDGLVDVMLKELSKEEVDYGYTYREKKVERKVGGGVMRGKQAVTALPEEEWTRTVLSFSKGGKGVLVMTFIERDNYVSEKALIEHMWQTLELYGE